MRIDLRIDVALASPSFFDSDYCTLMNKKMFYKSVCAQGIHQIVVTW